MLRQHRSWAAVPASIRPSSRWSRGPC
jgi:hypothetical protein